MDKRCNACKDTKSRDQFHKAANTSDGLQYKCKACHVENQRQRYAAARRKWSDGSDPYAVAGAKRCSRCRKDLPRNAFGLGRTQTDGLQTTCRQCASESRRERRYGMPHDAVEALRKWQDDKCANPACDGPARDMDHCHTTGAVRGLLCPNCNRALGLLKDSVERLNGLRLYLETTR
jgi:hypothetical protein